jgi:hypothetical protein
MREAFFRSNFFHRIGEMLAPATAWLIILTPFIVSPFRPALVAYLIIAFDLYFLYKSVLTAYYASLSFAKINFFNTVNFVVKIKQLRQAKKIKHFVIIPNYKEPIYKLHETIKAIASADYPFKNIVVVLAFEKRETEAVEKAREIKEKWRDKFDEILDYYHEIIPGEVPGKASNQTFAAKALYEHCVLNKHNPNECLITICDADSLLPKNYFSYLTHEFINDNGREFHFYWAPVLLYNNFWQLPFFVRMQATLSSILRLAFLSQKNNLIHISTYSTNLTLLKRINFWDVDIIPEDWHIYFQAFFAFGEKVSTQPLYTLVNGDAVYSGNMFKTLANRYEQEKRWAWGVTDISYFWNHMFITPHISWLTKIRKFSYLFETHLLWPTAFFILTVSSWIPPLLNPVFNRTVLGFLLPQLTGFILTLASVMLLFYTYLDFRLRHSLNQKTKIFYLPLLIVQWYFLPLVSFVLSALPALDAHTRLLLGKKITYKVTEKI